MLSQKLKDKIDLLTDLSCYGHHKTRDYIYGIEYTYDAGNNKDGWYPFHNGYLWDTDKYEWYSKEFNTFEEATAALEKAVDEEIKNSFKYFYDGYLVALSDNDFWGVDEHPNIKTKEDIAPYYKRWKELTKE